MLSPQTTSANVIRLISALRLDGQSVVSGYVFRGSAEPHCPWRPSLSRFRGTAVGDKTALV
jgi:hypothetical protein